MLCTFIWTLDDLKQAITNVTIDIIHFTLPFTSLFFVSTEYVKTSDISISLFIKYCNKFFTVAPWADVTEFLATLKA